MSKILILFGLIALPLALLAQRGQLSGIVKDKASGEVLAHATVFIANATHQTLTDTDGNFNLYNIRAGHYDLIVSIIGYQKYSLPIVVREDTQQLNIALEKKVQELAEVVVRPDVNRERYLEEFRAAFIGSSRSSLYRIADKLVSVSTPGAAQTRILNPDMIRFNYDEDSRELYAYTDDFLIIENKWLGYRLKYLVNSFTKTASGMISYTGQAIFEEMQGSSSQQKRWKQNRLDSYMGSAMHFYRSLLQDQVEFNHFSAREMVKRGNTYLVLPTSNKKDVSKVAQKPLFHEYEASDPLSGRQLVRTTDKAQLFALNFRNLLHVQYAGGHASKATFLKLQESYALFDLNGVLVNPTSVVYEGSWSTGVADLLPNDYYPE